MESELAIINACIKGNFQDINEYLSAGGSLELKDRNGNTCLVAAAASDRLDVAFHLVEKGADVNALNKVGNSALANAITRDNCGLTQFLLARGADVNQINHVGRKVIDLATSPKMKQILESYLDKEKMEKIAFSQTSHNKISENHQPINEKKRGSASALSIFKTKGKDKPHVSSSVSTISSLNYFASVSLVECLSLFLQRSSQLFQCHNTRDSKKPIQWNLLVEILPSVSTYLSRINLPIKQAQDEFAYINNHPILLAYYRTFSTSLYTTLLACHTIFKQIVYCKDQSSSSLSMLNAFASFASELGHSTATAVLPGCYLIRGIIQFFLSITTDAYRKVVIDRITQMFAYSSMESIVELIARKMTIISQLEIVTNSPSAIQKIQEIVWLPALDLREQSVSVLVYYHIANLFDHIMRGSTEEFVYANFDHTMHLLPVVITWGSNIPVDWSLMTPDTLVIGHVLHSSSTASSSSSKSTSELSLSDLNSVLDDDVAFSQHCSSISPTSGALVSHRSLKSKNFDIPTVPRRAQDIIQQYQEQIETSKVEFEESKNFETRSSIGGKVDTKLHQSTDERVNTAPTVSKKPSEVPPSKEKQSSRCIIT